MERGTFGDVLYAHIGMCSTEDRGYLNPCAACQVMLAAPRGTERCRVLEKTPIPEGLTVHEDDKVTDSTGKVWLEGRK